MKENDLFNEDMFREAFSDFSPEPPQGVLEKVQQQMLRKRNIRRGISGASAVVVIVAGLAIFSEKPSPTTLPEPTPAPTEFQVIPAEEIESDMEIETISLKRDTVYIQKTVIERKTVIIQDEAPYKKQKGTDAPDNF